MKKSNKRKKTRRRDDRDRDRRILHCAKRLVGIERLYYQEMDALLDALGLTRKEVGNG